MNSSFWDDVGVESVAQVNGIDVVAGKGQLLPCSVCLVDEPFQIAVHDSEKHLEK